MSHSAWAKAQPGLSVRAAAVLRTLADYADADGYTAVLVGVIRIETSLGTDRTVQRGLDELRRSGLLRETDDFKVINGRRVPLYRLALERGPQNTRERLAAERAASAELSGEAATGDTCVTPSGYGCHPCHPTGDTRVTPRVTPVSPKEKDKGKINLGVCAQALAPEAGVGVDALDRLLRRWSQVAPERVSPELAAAAWGEASARVEPARLVEAGLRYLAEAGEVKRARCLALHRWLSERRYEAWLTSDDEAAVDLLALAMRFPDAQARAFAVGWWCEAALDGERFARSYLDPARLDGRTIWPHTDYARGKLLEHPALWTRLNLTIAPAAGAGREGELVSAVASGAGGR